MGLEEQNEEQQNTTEEDALLSAGKTAVKTAAGLVSKTVILYVVLAILIFMSVYFIIVLLLGPALALSDTTTSLYAQIKGIEEEDVNPDEAAEYWFNAENVLEYLDEIFDLISKTNDGMTYITKANFKTILEKVIAYDKSVRRVDNSYTYYHHQYKTESTGTETVDVGELSSGGALAVPSLGIKNDASKDIREKTGGYIDDDGIAKDVYTKYHITDIEDTDTVAHVSNKSPEDDPKFKVSWQEIYAMAAVKSIVGNAKSKNWETQAEMTETQEPSIKAVARLDEATINSIISSFQFTIGYYFDPTSGDTMPGSSETYAGHTYTYEEMEKYAYVREKQGVNTEHGTEVDLQTPDFDYYDYKKPAVAPAYATNAYTTIEYDYTENADGTATLAGRQITIDGQKFYDYATNILGEDFDMEWFVQFVSLLPGSSYDAGNGSLSSRFQQILQSYKDGVTYSYYDSEFDGVGEVILGINCSRTELHYSTRRDENGDPVIPPSVELNITIDDITDEQIRADIAAGLYTLEDLIYVAACIQAEANSVDGQVAVAWCIRNRVESGHYSSYKDAVTAPGQFASPWANYLNNASAQAMSVAAGVLKGSIANPIGNCYFFFGAYSVWGYKPGTYHINVGGNMFYINWGDVTQVVGREGYVPF